MIRLVPVIAPRGRKHLSQAAPLRRTQRRVHGRPRFAVVRGHQIPHVDAPREERLRPEQPVLVEHFLVRVLVCPPVVPVDEPEAVRDLRHIFCGKIRLHVVQPALHVVRQQIEIHVAPDHRFKP
ncbi:hypothetical protein D3C81_1229900 [compost metagenome]